MARVSYFQRFSQKENHITNNTLLVMRYFYQSSPLKFGAILSTLIEENFEVGLIFQQQVKQSASVPDALIAQKPLALYFETKRGGDLDISQIERHIESIANIKAHETTNILFGLTSSPISVDITMDLQQKAKSKGIIFAPITYADIVSALREECLQHEETLKDILNDYEDYLVSENLLQLGDVMTVFPCGISLEENIRFQLYFEPAERPARHRSKFIGLYKHKCVRYLAAIHTIITGQTTSDGGFKINKIEKGQRSDEDINRIEGAIKACDYFPDFAMAEHRFYLFDALCETEINKTSRGGIWGARVFNLTDWLEYEDPAYSYSCKEAALLLKKKTFT